MVAELLNALAPAHITLENQPLACACGSADIVAVAPGTEDEVRMGMVVKRGVTPRAYCPVCWVREFTRG
jgi:hypothetical protein